MEEVEKTLKETRDILKPESNRDDEQAARYKQNYAHFESIPEGDRKQKIRSLKKMVKHGTAENK